MLENKTYPCFRTSRFLNKKGVVRRSEQRRGYLSSAPRDAQLHKDFLYLNSYYVSSALHNSDWPNLQSRCIYTTNNLVFMQQWWTKWSKKYRIKCSTTSSYNISKLTALNVIPWLIEKNNFRGHLFYFKSQNHTIHFSLYKGEQRRVDRRQKEERRGRHEDPLS